MASVYWVADACGLPATNALGEFEDGSERPKRRGGGKRDRAGGGIE